MRSNKKGQVMDIKELALTFIIVSAFAVVGMLIFSSVANTSDSLFDVDKNTKTNETVAIIQMITGSTNSTTLAESGYIEDSESVRNASNHSAPVINRNIDYKITLIGGATSGAVDTQANFTWLNVGYNFSNTTGVYITYDYNTENVAKTTADNLEDTFLDAYSLGMIALIVLAAVVVIAVLFRLSS